MINLNSLAAGICLTLASATASYASLVDISLTDNLDSISVTNDLGSSANITTVVYSFGLPGDGIATWDTDHKDGIATDYLFGSTPSTTDRFFQTVTWGGLSIAPGDIFSRLNMDVDLISALLPLSIIGMPDTQINTDPLVSLSHAFVSIFWSDGSEGTTALLQQPWALVQNFQVTSTVTPDPGPSTVPLPASLPLLAGTLFGLFGLRRLRQR